MPRPRKSAPPVVHPFDVEHGTDTSGLLPAAVIAEGTDAPLTDLTAYYGISPSLFESLIDVWLQRTSPAHSIERYTFLDVGAGKGRAVLLASRFPFAHVQGVELSPALARIAEANIDLWRQDATAEALAPISLVNADATEHPLPPGPTLAFLFHPFEAPVLRRFLRHVEAHYAAHRFAFDLIYANSEHGSLLDRHPAFTRVWEGRVAMSAADHVAELAEIALQKEYGSTGDELCSIYRFAGRSARR